MSTLLLIYMYWKSNGFYRGKPFRPAIGPLWVDIRSYPYDVIGSDTGPTWVCGGVTIHDTRSSNRSCDRSGDFSPTFSMFVYVC